MLTQIILGTVIVIGDSEMSKKNKEAAFIEHMTEVLFFSFVNRQTETQIITCRRSYSKK